MVILIRCVIGIVMVILALVVELLAIARTGVGCNSNAAHGGSGDRRCSGRDGHTYNLLPQLFSPVSIIY
uniref:Uncharacterized protein n=1 Tax=Rhizophora mucronata TaxID=61149 RepID=A0A2P2QUH8_RHIMU